MKNILLLFLTCLTINLQAQNPVPASEQSKPIALVGATIHVGNGQIITNGTLVFFQGILTAVGDATIPIDKTTTDIIELNGKHIYPSLIAMQASAGLIEISSVRATIDEVETGNFNPNVRAMVAFNTDSEVIPTIRGNGILIGQTTPDGGVISGTSAVMQYDGWNWEDAVLKKNDGMWLNWTPYFAAGKKNEKRSEGIAEINAFFQEALAYSHAQNQLPKNLKLEAMRGLFDSSMTLYIRATYSKEIIEAVNMAKQYQVKKIVIVGGEQAHLAIDFLKENNIPVVLGTTHRLPTLPDEDVYMPYKLPAILHKAGILTGLQYNGDFWRSRNLPFVAGTAAGFGLSKEEALSMITLNHAKILGIDKQVGSLEIGKHATLVVAEGDILDMRTNGISLAFIKGKKVDLDDKQKRLYRKFSDKYGK